MIKIEEVISTITPFDELESQQIQETLEWIQSGALIYRVQKPDIPPKHLVSYFILLDEKAQRVLLVDHLKAQLWLPAGGHVEQDEDPYDTVLRECQEELNIHAEFWNEQPILLTSTLTNDHSCKHTDVSLWYVLKGDHKASYEFDTGEFNGIRWFGFEDIPFEKSDPHMKRFISKLKGLM